MVSRLVAKRSALSSVGALVIRATVTLVLQAPAEAKKLRGTPEHQTLTTPADFPVNCSLGCDTSGLLLLTSSGLGTWGPASTYVPSKDLSLAFRDLILRLPDSAWESNGALTKEAARKRDFTNLSAYDFQEPQLYGGLDVVIIEDNCFLKESFWNKADPNFNLSSGLSLNYMSAGMKTSPALAQEHFGKGKLNKGWCVDFSSEKPGFLGGLGFDRERIHHLSLWDRLANDSLKTAIFNIATSGTGGSLTTGLDEETYGLEATAIMKELSSADVVVVNGGNPDFGMFVLAKFASKVFEPALHRVRAGSLVYVGQSAGSMVASADIGLSYDSTPWVEETLLQKDFAGWGIAGTCVIRPHDAGQLWDLASSTYGKLKGLNVVRVPNGGALRCIGALCHMVGVNQTQIPSVLAGPDDPYLHRLADAFRHSG